MRVYSSNWKTIGQGLGFNLAELAYIEDMRSLFNGAPYSYLTTMLSKWIEWFPGDDRGSSGYATKNALKKAVDEAGLGRTAREL